MIKLDDEIKVHHTVTGLEPGKKVKLVKYGKNNKIEKTEEIDANTFYQHTKMNIGYKPEKVLLQWDNIAQYTFFGMYDFFTDKIFSTEQNITYDEYFKRINYQTDSWFFMELYLKHYLNVDISKADIIKILTANYHLIIEYSPASVILNHILRGDNAIEEICIMGPENKIAEQMIINFCQTKCASMNINVKFSYQSLDLNEPEKRYKEIIKDFDPSFIVTDDTEKIIQILNKMKKKNINIYTPFFHNGLDDDFLTNYFELCRDVDDLKKKRDEKGDDEIDEEDLANLEVGFDKIKLKNNINIFFFNELIEDIVEKTG